MERRRLLRRFFFWLLTGNSLKYIPTPAEQEEGRKVRRLQKEIDASDAIIERKEDRIADLEEELDQYHQQGQEDKMWQYGAAFFGIELPQQPQKIINVKASESSEKQNLSEEEIRGFLKGFSTDKIKQAVGMGEGFCKRIVKSRYPGISDESIKKALEIAKEMVA